MHSEDHNLINLHPANLSNKSCTFKSEPENPLLIKIAYHNLMRQKSLLENYEIIKIIKIINLIKGQEYLNKILTLS